MITTEDGAARWFDGYPLGFAANGDALVFQTRRASGGESRVIALGQGAPRMLVENVSGAAMWGDTGRRVKIPPPRHA